MASKARSAKQIRLRIDWLIIDLQHAQAIAEDRLRRLAEYESDGLGREGDGGRVKGAVSNPVLRQVERNLSGKPTIDNFRTRIERELIRLGHDVKNIVGELDALKPATLHVGRGEHVKCENPNGCDAWAVYVEARRCATCYQYQRRNNGKDRRR
jgi:hypothetical protein